MHFSKQSFPLLKTTRLLLRPPTTDDDKVIFFLRSDPNVNRFIKRTPAVNIQEAREFVSKMQTSFKEGTSIYWVISFVEDNTMIGSICLWNFSTDGTIAEVGYDLKPNFQNKAIMSEALTEVLKFGFNIIKLNKIKAYTQYDNKPSIQLLMKSNFTLRKIEKDPDNKDNLIFYIDKTSWSLE